MTKREADGHLPSTPKAFPRQEHTMDGDPSTKLASDEKPLDRKFFLLLGVVVIGLFVFLQDVLGAINGGGIFSTIAALHRADAKTPMIDIDSAGLRSLAIGAICVIGLSICAYFKIDLGDRVKSAVAMLVIVGAGFVADAVYDERILDNLMVSKGYIRCENQDHDVGNGKSKVWFHNYVLDKKSCLARLQVTGFGYNHNSFAISASISAGLVVGA